VLSTGTFSSLWDFEYTQASLQLYVRIYLAMSAFTALNIIPNDESDDEIDNTREIQIEDALKLYQNALKLHSLGRSHVTEANEAYKALWESEIFKYPESQPFQHRQAEEIALLNYDEDLDNGEPGVIVAATRGEGTPSTLPQILYLAYKNYGLFMLDVVKHTIDTLQPSAIRYNVEQALIFFAEALERNDTDAGMWRSAAKIGKVLGSKRIMRFCLEGVLDAADEDVADGLEKVGLEEAFAGEDLKLVSHHTLFYETFADRNSYFKPSRTNYPSLNLRSHKYDERTSLPFSRNAWNSIRSYQSHLLISNPQVSTSHWVWTLKRAPLASLPGRGRQLAG
jgi:hypothetical protein